LIISPFTPAFANEGKKPGFDEGGPADSWSREGAHGFREALTRARLIGVTERTMDATGASAKRARLARVVAEATRIEQSARAWLARRRKRDAALLHRGRLDALEGALLGTTARLAASAPASLELPAGPLYRAAAAHERRLAMVDRLFEFFRTRFDQRDTEPAATLLDAADEVVRSLYLQPFRAAGAAEPAAPLAYVEPAFSPRAIPRDEPPSELRTDDDLLRAALARLPFGVVGLPPWCEEGPWTLVYLAHEIGHHVHFDLAPGYALVKSVGEALKQAAAAAGAADEGRAFQLWSKEIFADACSIATLGPAAVAAMVEMERDDDAAMLVPGGPAYPCAAVRLALMAAFAQAIGLDLGDALGGIDPAALVGLDAAARSEPQHKAAAHLAAVPAAAAALATLPLVGTRTLAQLCDLRAADFAPGGEAAAWAEALFAGKKRPRNATLRGTRLVLAGSWAAWRTACAIDDDSGRDAALRRLRQAASRALAENREPTTLAGPSPAEAVAIGKDLGDFLLARTPEELGV
jgi:hypothetical protein